MAETVAGQPVAVAFPARLTWLAAALLGLLAAGTALVAYLLARFPYDGLYGQDAYAYLGQARALWADLTGQPPPAGQLYSSAALYHWPIGYHLHLMLGFLFAGPGPAGGRALTLLLTVLTPALLALVTGRLWTGAPARARAVAGLLAGGALLLTGTYMRMGLSLMSDVPALFWSLLAVFCCLRAWPPNSAAAPGVRRPLAWAAAAGSALGVAILVRYGAALLLVPLLLYLLIRARLRPPAPPLPKTRNPKLVLERSEGSKIQNPKSVSLAAAVGLVAALLPQALYLLLYHADPGVGGSLAGWSLGNFLARTVTSPDGAAAYAQPMLVFYAVDPLRDVGAGFLSAFTVPALILGAGVLLRERRWPALCLLAGWWLGPALFFSGTTYQAQRFVIAYLPALAIALGIGGATALEWALHTLGSRPRLPRVAGGLAGLLVLVALAAAAWQGQRSVRDWLATHAGWKADEQQVIALARRAAGPLAPAAPPRVLAFGSTAALDYYTGWPTRELFNTGEPAITNFFAAPGPRLVVVPESSLATQWAHTPLATRWAWLRTHYTLASHGQAAGYTVYTVEGSRSAAVDR